VSGMQISECCRKNESSADVPPFCVPPITKSTRILVALPEVPDAVSD
jgi:hypothetical protein